jgi:hypothetical protein
MKQSKLESLVEASLNTASGFIVSLFVWQFIAAPLFGYHVTWKDNVLLTTLFTVVSVLRSYVWRRLFNRGWNRAIVRWLRASH